MTAKFKVGDWVQRSGVEFTRRPGKILRVDHVSGNTVYEVEFDDGQGPWTDDFLEGYLSAVKDPGPMMLESEETRAVRATLNQAVDKIYVRCRQLEDQVAGLQILLKAAQNRVAISETELSCAYKVFFG